MSQSPVCHGLFKFKHNKMSNACIFVNPAIRLITTKPIIIIHEFISGVDHCMEVTASLYVGSIKI